MTPRQRVCAAMKLRHVDKIPLMCQMSIGHMQLQLKCSPADFWHDVNVFADGLVTMRELYDFDGILVSLHGHDPHWRDHILTRRMTNECEEIVWKDGNTTLHVFDDLPRHNSVREKQKVTLTEFDLKSLPQTLTYIPVSQGLYFKIDWNHPFDIFTILKQKIGDEYSIHGEITSPFDYYMDILGYENGLMGLIEEPEKAHVILHHFTGLIKSCAHEMCKTGIDAIKISSPFAGSTFISPEFYAQFVLPYEKELANTVRTMGVEIYTHTCGSISDRLELMFDANVSGIECLDPQPLGNVELADAFKRIGKRGFIKGNIDSVNILLFGTEEEILADARQRIELGKLNGGFILSTACSIAPHAKREHIKLLRTAIDRWG
jgi:hypothetical protein